MTLDGLIDSRFSHVWYTTDSVDSIGKTNGITPRVDSIVLDSID